MSGAIWGIINMGSRKVPVKKGIDMQRQLESYKIDKFKYINFKNIFMGCGIQYITEESLKETLPYEDNKSNLIITADAIIDNREELLKELKLINNVSDFSDSQYILMAYKKWGTECTKHLLGSFAFVIVNKNTNKVFCAKDHLGTRSLYYYFKDNNFIFSTTIKPILECLNTDEVRLNERWIADFLSLMFAETSENEETIYDGIMQVQAAHSIVVENENITKTMYWDPKKKIKEIKMKNDEYIEKFMNIYKEAVKCRTRCLKDVGLFVSGGLDSTSVAALGSSILASENKVLKTYTSVPKKNFEKINKKTNRINDESNDVILLKNYIGNIKESFSSFDKNNAYNVIDDYLDITEQPYKILENSQWFNYLVDEAAKDNCKVILTGAYGNVTVSAGDFETYEKTLIDKLKFIRIFKEIKEYAYVNKSSRKVLVRNAVRSMVPIQIRKKRFYKKYPEYDKFYNSQVGETLSKMYSVKERFKKNEFGEPILKSRNSNDFKKIMVNHVLDAEAFNQITKMSLCSGVVMRDPTADIRIIEFCLSIPYERFFRKGIGRRLIRDSFKDLIPESILMNTTSRGLQGADWIERLKPIWHNIYLEISTLLNDKNINKYLNVEKIKDRLEKTKAGIDVSMKQDIRFLLETLIFSKFIYNFLSKKGFDFNEKELDKTRNEGLIS